MWTWTDLVNDSILQRREEIDLVTAFKLASVALFRTVDVHPFSDGNSRLCRLVASSMLSQHHFFPVYVQPATGYADDSKAGWRSIYINAIKACRRHPAHLPEDLCALLIESSWSAWLRVRHKIAEMTHEGRLVIGNIVLRGLTPERTELRVRERWRTLNHDLREPARDRPDSDIHDVLEAAAAAGQVDTAAARIYNPIYQT